MGTHPALVTGPIGRMLDATAAARPYRDPGTAALGAVWQRELDRLVLRWPNEVGAPRQASIERQVRAAVEGFDPSALASIVAPDLGGAALVEAAARTMAGAGMAAALDEAHRQGAPVAEPPPLDSTGLADWARAAADVLGSMLAVGAGREALRLWRPGLAADAVVEGTRTFFAGLTDRPLRDVLGGVLTRAQNLGKLAVYKQPPPPQWTLQLIADETLDANTCQPCRAIDGTVLPNADAAGVAYGGAGYLFCRGRERCRGTLVSRWIQQPPPEPQRDGWPLRSVLASLRPDGHTHHDNCT